MGSRTDQQLKEIEQIRARLRGRVSELESRIPAAAVLGKKAVVALAGVGGGGGTLWMLARRRGKRKVATTALAPSPVVVNVLPKGTLLVAGLAVAAWAGVKIFEATKRDRGSAAGGPAVVTKLPEGRQRTGS